LSAPAGHWFQFYSPPAGDGHEKWWRESWSTLNLTPLSQ
jgi:hypothetical protein